MWLCSLICQSDGQITVKLVCWILEVQASGTTKLPLGETPKGFVFSANIGAICEGYLYPTLIGLGVTVPPLFWTEEYVPPTF